MQLANIRTITIPPPSSLRLKPAQACEPCHPGKYINDEGKSDCDACGTGKYSPNYNMTSCLDCPRGTSQNAAGQDHCPGCKVGYYNNLTGQSDCTACGVGRFMDNISATACEYCQPGTYQAAAGQTYCSTCPAARFQDFKGGAFCKNCATGYSSKRASPTCNLCSVGYWMDEHLDDPAQEPECALCPLNAMCYGGLLLPVPDVGYWADRSAVHRNHAGKMYRCTRATCVGGGEQVISYSDDDAAGRRKMLAPRAVESYEQVTRNDDGVAAFAADDDDGAFLSLAPASYYGGEDSEDGGGDPAMIEGWYSDDDAAAAYEEFHLGDGGDGDVDDVGVCVDQTGRLLRSDAFLSPDGWHLSGWRPRERQERLTRRQAADIGLLSPSADLTVHSARGSSRRRLAKDQAFCWTLRNYTNRGQCDMDEMQCSDGAMGPLCGACEEGYFFVGQG